MEHRRGYLPLQSSCRIHAPTLYSWKNSKLLHAWEPYMLCSHMAFLCFCPWLQCRDCDGVVLVVDVVMGREVLLVAVNGERITIGIWCPRVPRCQPSYEHNKETLCTMLGSANTAVQSTSLCSGVPPSRALCSCRECPLPVVYNLKLCPLVCLSAETVSPMNMTMYLSRGAYVKLHRLS